MSSESERHNLYAYPPLLGHLREMPELPRHGARAAEDTAEHHLIEDDVQFGRFAATEDGLPGKPGGHADFGVRVGYSATLHHRAGVVRAYARFASPDSAVRLLARRGDVRLLWVDSASGATAVDDPY